MHVALLGASDGLRTALSDALHAQLSGTRIAAHCALMQLAQSQSPPPADASVLREAAAEHGQRFDLTLLLAPSDAPSDAANQRLRDWLLHCGLPFARIFGSGPEQLANAEAAIRHQTAASTQPIRPKSQWHWNCENCSDAACEHRLFADLLG